MVKKIQSDYWKDFSIIWVEEIKLWFGWTDWIKAVYKTGGQIIAIVLVFFFGGKLESFLDNIYI